MWRRLLGSGSNHDMSLVVMCHVIEIQACDWLTEVR